MLAAREDASGASRLLLEDLGHHGVARKDRDDQGTTVYLEEFSAVSDGARAAIDLAERLRDAGVGLVFVVQSYDGLGDEHQAGRLLAARPRSSSIACPSPSGTWPPPGPPAWDAQAELAELTADRRRRRRNQPPAWLGWLTVSPIHGG